MRQFVFGATNDAERDAWITAIMFLRTQAIQMDFSQKFNYLPTPGTPRQAAREAQSEKKEQSIISFRSGGGGGGPLASVSAAVPRRLSKFGGFPDKSRFSYARQSTLLTEQSKQQEETDTVMQCCRTLFSYSFAHVLGHLSEKAVHCREARFSRPPQFLEKQNTILFNSSIEQLVEQIEKDPSFSSILSSPDKSPKPTTSTHYERQSSLGFTPHDRLSSVNIQTTRHTVVQQEDLMGKPRSTIRRSSTMMHRTDRKLTEDDDDDSFGKLELEDSDLPSTGQKQSDNLIPEEPSEDEEENQEKPHLKKKLTTLRDLPAPVSIILEQVVTLHRDPLDERERFVMTYEGPSRPPEIVKSENNRVNTVARNSVPTVVFIERVQKKPPPRLASSILARNRTLPNTPRGESEMPRSPMTISNPGFQSLQQTPKQSMNPMPIWFGQHPHSQLLNSVYSSTSSRPANQALRVQPPEPSSKLRREDLSEIEGSQNPLLEMEDMSGLEGLLGVDRNASVKAIAIQSTKAVENPMFFVEDGEIFDVDKEGGIFPALGKNGMVQLKNQSKVGLFPLDHFKFSPPLHTILGLPPPKKEYERLQEEQRKNTENFSDSQEVLANEPSERFLQPPQVKFGGQSSRTSEVGSEENQTAHFENNSPTTPVPQKKKSHARFIKTATPGRPPRSPKESLGSRKKFLSPILTSNMMTPASSGQSTMKSGSIEAAKATTPREFKEEESKTPKRAAGRIFKKKQGNKAGKFIRTSQTTSARQHQPMQKRQFAEDPILAEPTPAAAAAVTNEEIQMNLLSSQENPRLNLIDSEGSTAGRAPHMSEPQLGFESSGMKAAAMNYDSVESHYQSERSKPKSARFLKLAERRKQKGG